MQNITQNTSQKTIYKKYNIRVRILKTAPFLESPIKYDEMAVIMVIRKFLPSKYKYIIVPPNQPAEICIFGTQLSDERLLRPNEINIMISTENKQQLTKSPHYKKFENYKNPRADIYLYGHINNYDHDKLQIIHATGNTKHRSNLTPIAFPVIYSQLNYYIEHFMNDNTVYKELYKQYKITAFDDRIQNSNKDKNTDTNTNTNTKTNTDTNTNKTSNSNFFYTTKDINTRDLCFFYNDLDKDKDIDINKNIDTKLIKLRKTINVLFNSMNLIINRKSSMSETAKMSIPKNNLCDNMNKYKDVVKNISRYHSPQLLYILRRYKFVICCENSFIKPTKTVLTTRIRHRELDDGDNNDNIYITEKIFNCFMAGTIPVYIGSTKIHDFINPESFILLSEFTDKSIIECVRKMIYITITKPELYLKMLKSPKISPKFDRNNYNKRYTDHIDSLIHKYRGKDIKKRIKVI